ncbi:transposase [Streptomyces sp. NPDC098101]|uniref:helix-turn-helix domain-containing protein n=1 Tax=Streptomyces sp. NPDC098101 TaxID=3366096 RepID=UPI00381A7123
MSFKPSPAVPPLTRPQLAEARRVRAAELFEQGRSGAEIARMLGVSEESVRRWRRVWDEGGADGLRRRPATGCPPKLDDAQVERVRIALGQGAGPMASRLICGRWNGSVLIRNSLGSLVEDVADVRGFELAGDDVGLTLSAVEEPAGFSGEFAWVLAR